MLNLKERINLDKMGEETSKALIFVKKIHGQI